MFNESDALALLEAIGGSKNILSVTHCVTRMRFVLNKKEEANVKLIESLKFVKGSFTSGGQFQVVIGTNVEDFYKIFIKVAKINEKAETKDEAKKTARKNMNFLERSTSHLAEIFIPILPAIVMGGLILGFRNVIGDLKVFNGKSLAEQSVFWQGTYNFLWLIGEAIFAYLPVGVTWSTVKKMGGTPVLGIVLGITLVSPQLLNAYNIGSIPPEYWDFGFFKIAKIGYQGQVIPALLAGITLALIENRLKKITPSSMYLLIVPFFALLITVILTNTIIGPLGREIGLYIATVVKLALTGKWAMIGAPIFGFLYAPIVITGLHQNTIAVELQLIQSTGGTPIFPLIALSNIAQGSAVLGVIVASWYKNKMEREVSVPAAIAAYLGVTEPALYGINLKYGFPMICAMIGSAVAAFFASLFGILANGIGIGGLPGILSVKVEYWVGFLICTLIAILVPLILTAVYYKVKFRGSK